MAAEAPKKENIQSHMRSQLAEDIFSTRSGDTYSEDIRNTGEKTMPAKAAESASVSEKPDKDAIDVDQQLKQMDRLRNKRKKLREAAVVSHAELNEESEDYKEIQKKIVAIRKRLNEIAVKGETQERKEEIQKLRDELARHFVALRKALKERPAQKPEQEGEQKPNAGTKETDGTSPQEWHAKAEGEQLYNYEAEGGGQVEDLLKNQIRIEEAQKAGEEERKRSEEKNKTYNQEAMDLLKKAAQSGEPVPVPAVEFTTGEKKKDDIEPPQEKKEYEKRLELREEWRAKKHAFDTAYRKYIEQSVSDRENRSLWQKLNFLKKEQKPDALTQLEKDYQDARRTYAESLHGAILERIDERNPNTDTENDKKVLQAALANRFVIKAAHERLRAEHEMVPTVEGNRTLQKLHEVFKKNGKLIKTAGYVAVGGIALASGGVAVAVALAGKAVQTKITTAAIAGGLTVGALAGNFVGDRIIASKDKKRSSAMKEAVYSFSGRNLDRLEVEYLNAYREHTKAVKNKKIIVGTGAALGALSGALIAGGLEVPDKLPDLPSDPGTPVDDFGEEEGDKQGHDHEKEEQWEEEQKTDNDHIKEEQEDAFEEKIDHTFPEEPVEPEPPSEDDVVEFYGDDDREEDESEEEPEDEAEVPPVLYTFEGGKVDTVSEALFEAWKGDPSLVEDSLSKKEFLAEMYTAIAEIEKDPVANAELMEHMHIYSGDIDKVQLGQTIDLQPFFEYLNNRK